MVFCQNWTLSGMETEVDDADDDNDEDIETQPEKTHKSAKDLISVFPSRRCIQMYVEDGHLLNLKLVAETLLEKGVQCGNGGSG